MKTYNVRNFPFHDLTAIVRKDWVVEFCNEIIGRELDIKWQLPSGTRSEVIDDEVADLLRRSGMLEMGYAPESGSEAMRKHIKKRVKKDKLYSSVKSAIKHDLTVQIFFIVGFPSETRRTVLETLGMVVKMAWLGVADVAMNHYMVLPGTEQTRNEVSQQWIADLGDDFYMIPLFGHTLMMEQWRKVNRSMSHHELTFYVITGFALFYSVLFLRHPRRLWTFLAGLFSKTDSSRLQLAIKANLRHKKNVKKYS